MHPQVQLRLHWKLQVATYYIKHLSYPELGATMVVLSIELPDFQLPLFFMVQ